MSLHETNGSIAAPPRDVASPAETLAARRTFDRRTALLNWLTFVVDVIAVVIGYVLAKGLVTGGERVPLFGGRAAVTLPLWPLIFASYGLYDRRELDNPSVEARRLFHAIAVSLVAVVMTTFWFNIDLSRGWIASLALTCTVTVGLGRFAVRRLSGRLSGTGRLCAPALVIGTNDEARTIARLLEAKKRLSYRVVAFVSVTSDGHGVIDGLPVLGSVDQIVDLVRETGAAAVVIAGTAVRADDLLRIDEALQSVDVDIRLTPGLPRISPSRIAVRPLNGLAMLSLDRRELGTRRATLKRSFDVVVAVVLLVLAFVPMVVIGVLVRLTSRGPSIFRQERVGKAGEPFTMYKFRTMVNGAEDQLEEIARANGANGVLFKLRDDPRVTPFGRVLRRWSLDELPQLWNVLQGDMSLVGPRPALPRETARYTTKLRARLRVKPGLTGLWQVNGRHELPFDDYVRYDLFYVENWSLGLDFYVIAKTLPALLGRRGSY
jgi:exopolysaccharide biosynthesis polyprenyl glycosylphosphotransferase